MIKKIAACLCVFALGFCLCGCEKSEDDSNKASQSTPSTQVEAKDIESSEDIVGNWRVEHPWPAGEAKEFGESLGIENFVTTAKWVFFIELKSDGTATYVKDYDLLMESAKESCYTIFSEAFAEAKQILDVETFEQKVKDTYGYECYILFLENNIPDTHKDSASYVQFFKEAQAEMLKYEDKPIEEQAAIGALWGEMSEEIEYSYEYVDGEWVSIKSDEMSWSYSGGVLYYGEGEYKIEGNNQQFYATQGDTTMTWGRLA